MAIDHNVLYVQTVAAASDPRAPSDVLMAILTSQAAPGEPESDTQSGSLLHFHQRLGHLAYDTVERMARDPASGIVLTDQHPETHLHLRPIFSRQPFVTTSPHLRINPDPV